jgi:alpha-D-xyloside xylohydrolase
VNFFSGEKTDGKRWLKNFEVPLLEMPVWVRYGARIPAYPESINCTDEMDLSRSVMIDFNASYKGIDESAIGKILK